jgi:hypothetical protein
MGHCAAVVVTVGCLVEQVKISELEDFVQLAFEGYKTLNRIQSRIFSTAWGSNENILVCDSNILLWWVVRQIPSQAYGMTGEDMVTVETVSIGCVLFTNLIL